MKLIEIYRNVLLEWGDFVKLPNGGFLSYNTPGAKAFIYSNQDYNLVESTIKSKLNENQYKIFTNMFKIYNISNNETLYVGSDRSYHSPLLKHLDESDIEKTKLVLGRIWEKEKVIGFWMNEVLMVGWKTEIKNPYITKPLIIETIKVLESTLGIDIIFGDYKIDISNKNESKLIPVSDWIYNKENRGEFGINKYL